MGILSFDRIDCVPVIHGRVAFAVEVRRRLLEQSYDAVAVELPATLGDVVLEAVEQLPTAQVVIYGDEPRFLNSEAKLFYVPVQPADPIIEALRFAQRERVPCHFLDADVEDFAGVTVSLPDPLSLHGLGIERYFEECVPTLARHRRGPLDELRESHMAAGLSELQASYSGRILWICGMAHWLAIRRHLEKGTGKAHPGQGIAEDLEIRRLDPRSLPHIMGEMPFVVGAYEEHRGGLDLADFDAVGALKELLLVAREEHREVFPGSLERPSLQSLRTLLDFARRLTVRQKLLFPSTYTLTVAANGVVGNDFALTALAVAHSYPWNPPASQQEGADGPDPGSWLPESFGASFGCDSAGSADSAAASGEGAGRNDWISMNSEVAAIDGREIPVRSRMPGSAFSYGRLKLERRPELKSRREYQHNWNPYRQCSWPPEDLVIENFRDYVGKRALSLARVAVARSEPFSTSYLDGIDIRATLRDVAEKRIFVREEPHIPGAVGGLVIIFEEDDFGMRYPWRSTWFAEHHNESTLSFYATHFMENLIGPGIARCHYGGCLLVYPPVNFPDVWSDLRFERARTPSERLLLAAIYWSQDHYVVHVGGRAPSPAVQEEARRRNKHILHLPLSTFGRTTLERLRRMHVLNGQQVRSWAQRFIR